MGNKRLWKLNCTTKPISKGETVLWFYHANMSPDASQCVINVVGFLGNWWIQSGQNTCIHKMTIIIMGIIRVQYRGGIYPNDSNLVLPHAYKDAESEGPPCNPSLSTALRKLPVSNIMAEILWLNTNMGMPMGTVKSLGGKITCKHFLQFSFLRIHSKVINIWNLQWGI